MVNTTKPNASQTAKLLETPLKKAKANVLKTFLS